MEDIDNEIGAGTAGAAKTPPNKEDLAKSKPIDAKSELDYYAKLKKKNKNYLLSGLTILEKERIAQHIIDLYNDNKENHQELCDNLTEYDSVYRMERKQVVGDDGDMPNYRSPLSTVAVDVIHANYMNVFFSPKDPIRPLPTEPNDAPKISKLGVFCNWSMKNELELFDMCDRLWHSSTKNGEAPYLMHWVKEYGTEIKRTIIMNPEDPEEPLYDTDTGEVIYHEDEETKLLYNGPKLEILSRKDYIQPKNSIMGEIPEWEMVIRRYSFDDVWKAEMSGKMFDGTKAEIKDWGSSDQPLNQKDDYEGDEMPVGKWKKEAILFFGFLRVNVLKTIQSGEVDIDEIDELEDEFIAEVHIESGTLMSLRKNKFPLKMRPVDVDYFIPDDEGLRAGIGVIKFMESMQKCYDVFLNQAVLGTMNRNNPIGFFSPTGNMRNDPMKIRNGYMYPTADPASVNFIQWPDVSASLAEMLSLINSWAQLLFGISDYQAGVNDSSDPSAPAKKAQIIVDQGNVRMNMIIKRKNTTLRNICKRWYLLYRDNMPPNKFMRVVGDDENNPWKFDPIRIEDFQLKSLPDFELTGNVLSANKQLQANIAVSTYQLLLTNPFFSPQSTQGMQALHSLTKWLIDKLDDTGLSRFMPKMPGDNLQTPEEENARFLQGDDGKPVEGDDHLDHIKKHTAYLNDSLTPMEIKPTIAKHIAAHIEMLRQLMTQQAVMQQMAQAQAMQGGMPGQLPQPMNPNGGNNGQINPAGQGAPTIPNAGVPRQISSMGSAQGRVPGLS